MEPLTSISMNRLDSLGGEAPENGLMQVITQCGRWTHLGASVTGISRSIGQKKRWTKCLLGKYTRSVGDCRFLKRWGGKRGG
jgi:hypothetical protein